MRLKSYLLTKGRTKEISEKQFINDVKKKCSQIVSNYKKTDNFYYRGITTPIESSGIRADYGFVQPSKFTRESAWASRNTYTLMIDNLPFWNKYPKRSKSIVMTTDRFNAESRGHNVAYIIFPVNGSKIGICPRDDIWDSFPKLTKKFKLRHLNGFNHMMATLISWIGKNAYDQDNWNDIENFLQLTPSAIVDESKQEYIQDNYGIDPNKTLAEQIIPYFDPKTNGFKLFTTKDKVPTGDLETWTDGDSYLINNKVYKNENIEDQL